MFQTMRQKHVLVALNHALNTPLTQESCHHSIHQLPYENLQFSVSRSPSGDFDHKCDSKGVSTATCQFSGACFDFADQCNLGGKIPEDLGLNVITHVHQLN